MSILLIFVIRENEIFTSVIRYPLFFPFMNRAKDPLVRHSFNDKNCMYLIT